MLTSTVWCLLIFPFLEFTFKKGKKLSKKLPKEIKKICQKLPKSLKSC